MALVRFSALKGAVHGVLPDGGFVHADYDRRRRVGKTAAYAEPDSDEPAAAIRVGDPPLAGRALATRGFPAETSDLAHLARALVGPAVRGLVDGPVVIMVHGFLFDPRVATSDTPRDSDNPHSRLYHFQVRDRMEEIRHHTTGWPAGLGFGAYDRDGADGLAVAFGWHSRPGFAASLITRLQNFYARAYAQAEGAAWNLLTLVHLLDRLLPQGKPVDLFCHSLGARVVVRMIALAAKHNRLDLLSRLDRAIVLGGAEYVVEARHMLQRLHKVGMPSAIQIYNVVSRENDVLDKLGENFGPGTFGNTNVIGHNGLDVEDPVSLGPSWLDIQIDSGELAAWMLRERGLRVTGDNPASVWDHWYYFTDPDNMALYRAILRDRDRWRIADLRAQGMPDRVSLRRSVYGD